MKQHVKVVLCTPFPARWHACSLVGGDVERDENGAIGTAGMQTNNEAGERLAWVSLANGGCVKCENKNYTTELSPGKTMAN